MGKIKWKIFIDDLNNTHPTVNFTGEWSNSAINFLDVEASLKVTFILNQRAAISTYLLHVILSDVKREYSIVKNWDWVSFVLQMIILI